MLGFFVVYCVVGLLIVLILNYKTFLTSPLPELKLTKHGLTFCSTKRHKINTGDVKLIQLENVLYLKKDNRTVIIKNVNKAILKKGYVYFTGLGKVNIIFSCSFYKYFNLDICSSKFDLSPLKKQALNQIANNLFDLNSCNFAKRYIHILKNILNITLKDGTMSIKQNKYLLPFNLSYKANNTLKTIKVNPKG